MYYLNSPIIFFIGIPRIQVTEKPTWEPRRWVKQSWTNTHICLHGKLACSHLQHRCIFHKSMSFSLYHFAGSQFSFSSQEKCRAWCSKSNLPDSSQVNFHRPVLKSPQTTRIWRWKVTTAPEFQTSSHIETLYSAQRPWSTFTPL